MYHFKCKILNISVVYFNLFYSVYRTLCSVQKTHSHIQVNFTFVKIGGCVSNNIFGGSSDRKLEWIESM